MPNKRKIWSLKQELLIKSREAMLSAVQVFNNPNILFKSESFIVLSNIAWTYLMHVIYRKSKIDYRYFKQVGLKKKFDKTKRGAYKFWELERCLNDDNCRIEKPIKENLKFLIGLRHEIEHQMTTKIDDILSARFQACCINFNQVIKVEFGDDYGIDKHLSISLQFSSISEDQADQLKDYTDLPKNISAYIGAFDDNLEDSDFQSTKYSYRVFYVPKLANNKGQADRVIEFIRADSPAAQLLNKEVVVLKETEKTKHLPAEIVKLMVGNGYTKFNYHHHTKCWKALDAKNPSKGFGVMIATTWYWYDKWLKEVEAYCLVNKDKLT